MPARDVISFNGKTVYTKQQKHYSGFGDGNRVGDGNGDRGGGREGGREGGGFSSDGYSSNEGGGDVVGYESVSLDMHTFSQLQI